MYNPIKKRNIVSFYIWVLIINIVKLAILILLIMIGFPFIKNNIPVIKKFIIWMVKPVWSQLSNRVSAINTADLHIYSEKFIKVKSLVLPKLMIIGKYCYIGCSYVFSALLYMLFGLFMVINYIYNVLKLKFNEIVENFIIACVEIKSDTLSNQQVHNIGNKIFENFIIACTKTKSYILSNQRVQNIINHSIIRYSFRLISFIRYSFSLISYIWIGIKYIYTFLNTLGLKVK